MSKVTLNDLMSSFAAIDKMNANFDAIETAFDNTISRDGTAPNAMLAPLDMNSQRIINLGAPVNPTDAVRLQDVGTGGTVTIDWSTIANKPTTFTAAPMSYTNVTDFSTGVSNSIAAGTNISITQVGGKSQINATGTLVADWNTMVNKPSTFAPAAHVHPESDITNLSTDLAGKAALVHTHVHTDITDWGTGVASALAAGANITLSTASGVTTITAAGSGASGQKPALLSAFGTISSDGTTTSGNDTAFTGAESDPESDIYIPDATKYYKTTKSYTSLSKNYVGRGKIVTSEGTMFPAKFSYLGSAPPGGYAGLGAFPGGWFDGDQRFTDGGEYKIIDGTHRSFNQHAANLTSGASSGASSLTVNNINGAVANAPIQVMNPPGTVVYTGTISSASGTTINITPNLGVTVPNGAVVVINPNQAYYFQSTTMPHHAWFDIKSGSGGYGAFMSSGATAGSTSITTHAAPDASWVGQTAIFRNTASDTILEAHKVTAVGPGNKITIQEGLLNNYTWNPVGGLVPMFTFGYRTWTGHTFVKVTNTGGGDNYGHVVRQTNSYVPKASETHCFMASTVGQYGGDMSFGTSGVYGTGWESQYNDNGNDVAAIAQVDSFGRSNDTSLTGGQVWVGTKFQSSGLRPIDVGHCLTGRWRNGLDTVYASMMETTLLVANTTANGTTISVKSSNGAVAGDQITIGDFGLYYIGTISTVSGTTITVSPNLPATPIVSGTIVNFSTGGAVLNMALGQKIVFNSTVSNNARSGDPMGVFSPHYGNVQGDIVMGTATDSSDYWYVKFNGNGHGGNNAKLRLHGTQFNCNVDFLCGGQGSFASAVTSGGGDPTTGTDAVFTFKAGSGNYIRFNVAANRYEFYKGNSLASVI